MNDGRSKLANLEELRKERDVRRSSQCSDGEIKDVIKANYKAATESDIEHDIIIIVTFNQSIHISIPQYSTNASPHRTSRFFVFFVHLLVFLSRIHQSSFLFLSPSFMYSQREIFSWVPNSRAKLT